MSFQGEMWVFLLLLAVGSLVYVSFGDYSAYLFKEREADPLTKLNGFGLDYEIISRVHLFGFFIGCLGTIGLIIKLREMKLIH